MNANNNNSKKIGETEFVKEASIGLGFVHDNLLQVESSCGNIDTATLLVENALEELKKYANWAGLDEDFNVKVEA